MSLLVAAGASALTAAAFLSWHYFVELPRLLAETRRELARAEDNFRLARSAVDEMFTRDAAGKVLDNEALRRELLRAAEELRQKQ